MSGEQIFVGVVCIAGVIALAVQYGIAIGERRREQRIERQRGVEIRALLDWVGIVWRRPESESPTVKDKR